MSSRVLAVASLLALGLCLLVSSRARADGVLIAWGGQDLDGMSEERWEAAKKQPCQWVLEHNRSVESWPEVYLLALAAKRNLQCKELLPGLVAQLSDGSERKLTQTRRLIIWERITSGDLVFDGQGLQVADDLFTVAGRANWLLRTLTGKNFGTVTPRASKASLNALQAKWKQFLAGEQVAEAVDAYASPAKGLEELRSPAALEALVVALAPAQPEQAAYIHHYLAALTEVAEQHPAAWWARWWKENRGKLKWSPEQAKFVVRP
jgi:hypothetical protein